MPVSQRRRSRPSHRRGSASRYNNPYREIGLYNEIFLPPPDSSQDFERVLEASDMDHFGRLHGMELKLRAHSGWPSPVPRGAGARHPAFDLVRLRERAQADSPSPRPAHSGRHRPAVPPAVFEGGPMAAPKELPLEARRAAWDALWRILLAPRPSDGSRRADPARPVREARAEIEVTAMMPPSEALASIPDARSGLTDSKPAHCRQALAALGLPVFPIHSVDGTGQLQLRQ